jgi:predicted N-formylglutamate amidohydrolase
MTGLQRWQRSAADGPLSFMALLTGEEEATILVNAAGTSPILLVCEHAGRRIPKSLARLGLPQAELERHIAYDIGAEEVACGLAATLDSPLALQRYSRLVYDCNRPPDSPTAIPELSELTQIPGNKGLSAEERRARIDEIYLPFHAQVAQMIDRRLGSGRDVFFVTIHSFTPVFKGISRNMHVGLLFDRDRRFTDQIAPLLRQEGPYEVRLNEPYGPGDGVCHTLNIQAGVRGLPYSMIEIRNDLIRTESGQREWADRLAKVLQRAAANLEGGTTTASFHEST